MALKPPFESNKNECGKLIALSKKISRQKRQGQLMATKKSARLSTPNRTIALRPEIIGTLTNDLSIEEFTFAPIGFLPIREFGLALSINTFIGLFFDLAVLPKILSSALD